VETHTLDLNLIALINRDYELIRRFKTTCIISCFSVDLSQKIEVVFIDRVYFGAKLKSYDATMKRAVK